MTNFGILERNIGLKMEARSGIARSGGGRHSEGVSEVGASLTQSVHQCPEGDHPEAPSNAMLLAASCSDLVGSGDCSQDLKAVQNGMKSDDAQYIENDGFWWADGPNVRFNETMSWKRRRRRLKLKCARKLAEGSEISPLEN